MYYKVLCKFAEIKISKCFIKDKLGIISDASYCDQDESMSTYGYVAYLGGPVSWACKTTTNQAKSTCEAEYIAMSAATSEVIYLQNLLGEMGFQ